MRKTYEGREVDVSFDPEVCRHAGNCVRGLPTVFSAALPERSSTGFATSGERRSKA
jgi:uncharacterized Fe-S cluster protein YjdI